MQLTTSSVLPGLAVYGLAVLCVCLLYQYIFCI